MSDADMIKSLDYWPSWPFLPVKRRDRMMENKNLGCLIATEEHHQAIKGNKPFVIYHVYMFKPPKTQAEWDSSPKTEYQSLELLLADGWEVD